MFYQKEKRAIDARIPKIKHYKPFLGGKGVRHEIDNVGSRSGGESDNDVEMEDGDLSCLTEASGGAAAATGVEVGPVAEAKEVVGASDCIETVKIC